MVRTLREMGEVIATIGNGTNHAPMIPEAVLPSVSRHTICKGEFNVVIMDDNFALVVKVV